MENITTYQLAKLLFPIPRSITGDATRKIFRIFRELHSEFCTFTFKSGERVVDWEIPDEWGISDANIELEDKTRICEFQKCNFSVIGYSTSINKTLSFEELIPLLHYC